MSDIVIIGLPQSNFVWTTRIVCGEKGLAYRNQSAPPHDPAVAALHPLGKIPVLRHGDVTLFESRAICAYLDSLPGPALVPRDGLAAAQMEQWLSLIATDLEPIAIRRLLFGYMFPNTADGAPDRAQIDAAWEELGPRLALLEARLAQTRWVAGADFSLADCYLLPVLHYLGATAEGRAHLAGAPVLAAYLARGMERASVRETAPVTG